MRDSGRAGPALNALLAAPVQVAELRDARSADPLHPAEEAALADVLERRRHEFAAGRHCARRALERLGVPAAPILSGPDREPLWPNGVVGSITHCEGYAAAAVARRADLLTIGIDAEPHAPLPDGVLRRVAGDAEREWLESADRSTAWDRVLFCAKESVYKAWFPLAGRWLGFKDAVVTLYPTEGTFEARLLVPGPVERLEGRFAVSDGLVLTACQESA